MAPPPPPKISKKKQRQALEQQQKQAQQLQQKQNLQRHDQRMQQQRLQQQRQQQERMEQQQQQAQQQQLQAKQQRIALAIQQYQQRNNQQQQQPLQRPQFNQMPCNNPQQRSRTDLQLRQTLNPECDRLLAEVDQSEHGSIHTDANKASVFWSRESLKYLDDLFKMTSNSDTMERLNRVLQRSQRGLLSHNDYRAVIRLHSLLCN